MIREYQKESSKVKKDITLFLITDLHYYEPSDIKKYQFITNALQKEQPNFLMIGGDLLDSAYVREENRLIDLLEKWATYTTIFINIGNHDITTVKKKSTFYEKNEAFWKRLSQNKHIILLDNHTYEDENVSITGVTLPYDYYYGNEDPNQFLKKHLKKKNTNQFQILLIHAAKAVFDYPLEEFDLVLAGHNHNGMVPKILEPIMKHRGLISPGKTWFPNYVRGRFSLNGSDVIISGGVTKLSKRSHLAIFDRFWKHELTKITIKSKNVL